KYIGISIVCFLLSLTVIGLPFAVCMKQRWIINNTKIVGMPLMFEGKGINLMGKMIVWGFFTIITLSLYSFVIPCRFQQWKAANTVFAPYDD
ncbi:MAG: hypothetical protein ACOCWI_05595, partial [Bacillota bacterium]